MAKAAKSASLPKTRTRSARGASGRSRPRAKAKGAYHHGDLRRALLDAAWHLIETDGASALTLRAAARLAKVSQAAPYRHFDSKEALLAAMAEEGFRGMVAHMHARLAELQSDDPVARFQVLGQAYVEYAVNHPSHFRIMFGPEVSARLAEGALHEAGHAASELLFGSVAECIAAGIFPPEAERNVALAAWSAVHGLSALMVDGRFADLPAAERQTLPAMMTSALFGFAFRGDAPRSTIAPTGTAAKRGQSTARRR